MKRILIGLSAGLLVGTILIGVGGRFVMRVIALMGGLQGGFSWGGSLEVVLLGLIIGALSGAIYGLLHSYLFSNRWITGTLYGLIVFLAIIVLPIEGKGAAKGFPDLQWAVYLFFGVLHIAYGVVLAFLFDRMK